MFPPGRPSDRVIEHTIDLRLPKIEEWMGKPHIVVYPSMNEFQWGYQQTRDRGLTTNNVSFKCCYELLVTPLGLTSAPDII